MNTEHVRDEDLRVGDVVVALRKARIVAIRPYTGPLTDIIFAIADTDIGSGFSLAIGGYTEVTKRVKA